MRSAFDVNHRATNSKPDGQATQSSSRYIREEERAKNTMSKVWLITGSSRGIGRKLVEAALEAGDHVVATARKPERLDELVDQYGGRIRTVQHDIRDASAATTATQIAVDAFERIDVVVNAARSAAPELKTSASTASGFLWRPISLVSLT